MKNVILISGSLPPIKCGVGYYTRRLIDELAGTDKNFSVISTTGVEDNLQVPLYTVPNWKISSLYKLLKHIKKSGADIVHIQYPAVGYKRNLGINLLPYCLRLFTPRKEVLVTLHEYHESRWVGRLRDLITAAPAHKIIVSNKADQKDLPPWLGKKTSIIPIGSNFEKAKKDPSVYKNVMAKAKLDLNMPTLMFFGFAYPNKNLEVLLDALRLEPLRDYQLLLLSGLSPNDPYQNKLLKKVAEINLRRTRVGVAGFLDDTELSAVLQEGRYFVLPQQKPVTGKSSTAITAVTHGLILISAGSHDPSETEPFKHERNCYLISPVLAESLAEAIDHLNKSPRVCSAILDGTKELTAYFSWKSIVDKHLEFYEKS